MNFTILNTIFHFNLSIILKQNAKSFVKYAIARSQLETTKTNFVGVTLIHICAHTSSKENINIISEICPIESEYLVGKIMYYN